VIAKLQKQWFLIALSMVVLAAYLGSQQLHFLTKYSTARQIIVMVVMFLMALPLPLSSFLATIKKPTAPLLASFINLGVGPILTLLFLAFLDKELAGGLAVALATPCTLASATVWTRRSGGSDIVAIMVTVVTNLCCVVITPMWVFYLAGEGVGEMSFWKQVGKLSYLVVLPICAAQVVRSLKPIALFAAQKKTILSTCAQTGLLYIVLVGTISSTARLTQSSADSSGSSLLNWGILLFAIAFIHLTLFFIGLAASKVLALPSDQRKAVAISGSQKTLMVGAEVGIHLGLSILPLVIYHLFQLFVDTILADWMARRWPQNPND